METNREKFNKIATSTNTELLEEIAYRNANREWLRRSNRIAAKVLMALKEQKMTQKDLAEKMSVTPQYINKIVKGGENLTTETITKLENILGIAIFADSIRDKNTKVSSIYNGTYDEAYYASASDEFLKNAI
ncbi:MAG: helix-turn-helix transcriptional regulator [Dysgonomonadaceae bacterium]|jgi:transcriptional regulator with XRE-family HTH domain|nr:helix-turn-helix transcriptional regulator [Dysgonamonadaceae bacterium]